METAESIEVEVVYALPARQRLLRIRVPAGATVETAVRQSGILAMFPEIDLARAKLGIFSRRVGLHHVLCAGDRIEIYRRLLVDPKSARRARARAPSAKG
jgi:putative ubiquitin-RnfH superfamily antitoxin RatB of RatAB toxin-antitoxin module